MPKDWRRIDFEVELAVVIGSPAKNVAEGDALGYVAGYCICNDVSERGLQKGGPGEWIKAKSQDSFGPLGPWLVTKDEVPDPQNLALALDLNGARMQTGNTSTMVFGVAQLVSYMSQFMTLMPGDVITTGTPPGVGMARNPRVFLKAGDELQLTISGLGEQSYSVRGRRLVPVPPGVEMMDGTSALAGSFELVGGEDGVGDIGLGDLHRLDQTGTLGEFGGDRRRQGAAGAVRVVGLGARGFEAHRLVTLEQNINGGVTAGMTAFNQHGSSTGFFQLQRLDRHLIFVAGERLHRVAPRPRANSA